MKKRQVVSIALASAMAASMGLSAAAATDVAATDLAYKGELELMHYYTSEEADGNGGSDAFRTTIANWEAAHPDITLNQNVIANAEYKTEIATLAAADDLPDVFLLQGMNTIAWADQGLVMDLTDTIKASPYYDQYNQSYFTPFTVGDKIYGFPALTGGTCTVVIYDKQMWKDAGFDTFPSTWEDVEKALKNLGQYPFTKIRNDFVNVHEQAVMNLLGHQNQYILLDSLLREAIAGNAASNFHIHWVYEIQKGTEISYKKEEEKEVLMYCISMKKSGSELRKAIMTAKKDTTGDSLRGIEYQLLNALSVKNTEKFMDIVARLYSSYGSEKLLIPNGMIRMLQDKEKFSEYGYAFVLGLIGCYEGKKEVEQ